MEKIRVTLNLSDQTYLDLEDYAASRGIKTAEVIQEALDEFFSTMFKMEE